MQQGHLTIIKNESLSICEVQSICNYLENGGNSNIEDNSTGCNNEDEVIDACLVSTELITKENKIIIFPNPVNSTLNISIDIKEELKSIAIFNQVGQMILRKTSESKVIDVSRLTTGIYYLEVETNKRIRYKKIIIE